MRTTLSILLSACAALVVAGCAHKPVTTAAPAPAVARSETPTPAPAPSPQPAEAAPAAAGGPEAIFFSFDDALVQSDARPVLQTIAVRMKANPRATLRIEGNCDERGTTQYNLVLGEQRARAARDYLVRLGIAPQRIDIVSYGSERPRQTAHDEQAWAQNRRDDFRLR